MPAAEMTSRQRVQIAMDLGVPDRVPTFCQLAIGHYFLHSGRKPLDIWMRSESLADAQVALQRRYQFDGILVNLPGRDPDFEKHIDHIERNDRRFGASIDAQTPTNVRWRNAACRDRTCVGGQTQSAIGRRTNRKSRPEKWG